ncbi:MAG: hypothetical protein V3V28_07895 [Polaribacter sp.]|uniref:hypothetical protein n=1 Tax=Polaribacter sp. TaxID=1920175 RepID=UPI002F34F1AB
MRTLFLSALTVLFLSNNTFSQSTPKAPKTPSTSTKTKGTSYSITFDTDDKEDNSSVSIKRNDNVYKFSARFHESKTGSIKKLLVDKLGNSGLSISGDTYKWIKNEDGEKIYECKLTDDTLKIYVDKQYANANIIHMMNDFGDVLKDAISGTDSKKDAKENAEKELKSAERELARAKRQLERVKKKNKKTN